MHFAYSNIQPYGFVSKFFISTSLNENALKHLFWSIRFKLYSSLATTLAIIRDTEDNTDKQ